MLTDKEWDKKLEELRQVKEQLANVNSSIKILEKEKTNLESRVEVLKMHLTSFFNSPVFEEDNK